MSPLNSTNSNPPITFACAKVLSCVEAPSSHLYHSTDKKTPFSPGDQLADGQRSHEHRESWSYFSVSPQTRTRGSGAAKDLNERTNVSAVFASVEYRVAARKPGRTRPE
jgi:hypothetical protein